MGKVLWSISIATMVLAACPSANSEEPANPVLACYRAIPDDPELQAIKDKVALLRQSSPTLEMLANNNKPTKPEKVAISKWVSEKEKCDELAMDGIVKHNPPVFISILDRFKLSFKVLCADLYSGKLTYSEFGRSLAEAANKRNVEMTEAMATLKKERDIQSQRTDDQLRRDAAARQAIDAIEAQRSASRDAAINQYLSNQQAQTNALNAQAQAQSQRQINCRSQPMGGYISTTCN